MDIAVKDLGLCLVVLSAIALLTHILMTPEKIRQLIQLLDAARATRDQAIADRDAANAAKADAEAARDAAVAQNAALNDPALVAEVDTAIAKG